MRWRLFQRFRRAQVRSSCCDRNVIVFATDYAPLSFEPKGHNATSDKRTIPLQMRDGHSQVRFTLVVVLASARTNTDVFCKSAGC